MHCDGARMWEVVAKTGMSLEELCRPFDTVSLCMSKGLGAPIGRYAISFASVPESELIFCLVLAVFSSVPESSSYVRMILSISGLCSADSQVRFDLQEKVKWFRKAFGGGIRQCGSLAVAANWCLDNHLPRLSATHDLARHLAVSFAEMGAELLLPVGMSSSSSLSWSNKADEVSCAVETNMLWLDPQSLGFNIADLAKRAKSRGITLGSNRMVVHHQVTKEACDELLAVARELKEECKENNKKPIDQEQNLRFAEGTYEKAIQPPIARLGTVYGQNQ